MTFGMSDRQYDLLQKLVILPLKQSGAEVFIFGSRVTGKHHPHSDVDILYRSKIQISTTEISRIKEAIEESRFPFIVDLVNDADLVATYRSSVEATMVSI